MAATLSTLATVQTLDEVVPEYACGLPLPGSGAPSNATPLPALRVGDLLHAGDFPVSVTESSGQDGTFSGKGTVALPWLRESLAQVIFQDVQVNEQYQLTGGQLVVNGVALDVIPEEWAAPIAQVLEAVEQADQVLEKADAITQQVDETVATAQSVVDQVTETVALESEQNSDRKSVSEGTSSSPAQGGSSTINAGGSGTTSGTAGSASTSGGSAASAQTVPPEEQVQFEAAERQAYGFDAPTHAALAADYPPAFTLGEDYPVAWKSVASNRTDAVVARTAQADWPANLQFRTTTGLPVSAQPTAADNARKLTVTGTSHETTDELTAFISETDSAGNEQQTVVGQLNLISYDELRQKVIIVPVADEAGNQALAPNAALLERTLNDIYGQAVAHWEVVVDQPLTVEADMLDGLDEGQSGLLASFPQKMRQFNRAFKRSRDIDNDAYYLFLIPPGPDDSSGYTKAGPSRLGFMPFKKQFGYIFTERANDLSHTIAHELGHGAFRLRHPFDERGLAQGSTDNLMDYSQGIQLYKYQWDNVHNPEAMVGWLQDDEESALRSAIPVLRAIRKANQTGKKSLDLTAHSGQTLRSNIKIKEHSLRVVIVLNQKGQAKNVINPGKPSHHQTTSAFGEYNGDFTRLHFLNGSYATVKIITDTKDVAVLEDYLLGEKKEEENTSYQEEDVTSNFDRYQKKVFNHEGGFVNDPVDKGGATNKGITFNTFKLYAKSDIEVEPTLSNLKLLTNEQAAIIYKKRFWNTVKADDINNASLAYALYDFNVNAGNNAAKVLQRVLNSMGYTLSVDGNIGSKTVEAINSVSSKKLFKKYKQARIDYYQLLVDKSVDKYKEDHPKATEEELIENTQKRFEKGWKKRANSITYEKD